MGNQTNMTIGQCTQLFAHIKLHNNKGHRNSFPRIYIKPTTFDGITHLAHNHGKYGLYQPQQQQKQQVAHNGKFQ